MHTHDIGVIRAYWAACPCCLIATQAIGPYILYYFCNASQTKSELQDVQCSDIKEEPTLEAAVNRTPPLVARASSVIAKREARHPNCVALSLAYLCMYICL